MRKLLNNCNGNGGSLMYHQCLMLNTNIANSALNKRNGKWVRIYLRFKSFPSGGQGLRLSKHST